MVPSLSVRRRDTTKSLASYWCFLIVVVTTEPSFFHTRCFANAAFLASSSPFLISRTGRQRCCADSSSRRPLGIDDSFAESSREWNDRSVPEIQTLLVQKGVAFHHQQQQQQQQQQLHKTNDRQGALLQSSLDKVPGCVASVYIQTSLREHCNNKNNACWEIQFHGSADALISRGLVAVLISCLSSFCNNHDNTNHNHLKEILSVDPNDVADRLGIRRALSPGRNDGLASMMKVIQGQIESLLETQNNDKSGKSLDGSSTSTIFSTDEVTQGISPLFIEAAKSTRITPNNEKATTELLRETTHDPCPQQRSDSHRSNNNNNAKRVALLLSGGVDSSVALRLLLQQGYNVTAFYLKIWLEDELAHLGQCPWEDDYHVCQQVCQQAGVSLETLSLQDEYRDRVISYTIHEAQRGRTPNPDILCNSRIKFGCFYDAIAERDFDYVASGHYARLEPNFAVASISYKNDDNNDDNINKTVRLFRAPDPVKDQSYFLCALTQEQLKRVIFPIGHLEKTQVRELAEEFQLPNRNRADSQGLCFLGKVKFEDFLNAYLGDRPGDIVDAATGDILGRHRGVWFHTVGQRKGIGKVLNPLATSRGPWYVVAKDPDHDLVFCSNEYDKDIFSSARSEFHVEDIQWIAGAPPPTMDKTNGFSRRFTMKIRHGPRLVAGALTLTDLSSFFGQEGTVKLDQKDGGLAPGQYVVFYDGDECFGGGVISERHWARFLTEHNKATTISTKNATMVAS